MQQKIDVCGNHANGRVVIDIPTDDNTPTFIFDFITPIWIDCFAMVAVKRSDGKTILFKYDAAFCERPNNDVSTFLW